MIRLYRATYYSDRVTINFHGDATDQEAIQSQFRCRVYSSTDKNSYEGGYYTTLRQSDRIELSKGITQYLASNFTAPHINLLTFASSDPLPSHRLTNKWAIETEAKMTRRFRENGWILGRKQGLRVFSCNPKILTSEIELLEGAHFRLELDQYRTPYLTIDILFGLSYRGELVENESHSEFLLRQESDRLEQEYKKFVTRDTEQWFRLGADFVTRWNSLADREEIKFNVTPISADKRAFETWQWGHDSPIALRFGNDKWTSLPSGLANLGAYKFLPSHLHVVFLYPQEVSKRYLLIPCQQFEYHANKLKKETFQYLDLNLTVIEYEYSLGIEGIKTKLAPLKNQADSMMIIIISPPEDARRSTDTYLKGFDQFTGSISRELRHIWNPPPFTLTLPWDNLRSYPFYAMEALVLKGLASMGVVLWRLAKKPRVQDEDIGEICFIGVDLNRHNKDSRYAGGVIFDGYGILQGYHAVPLETKGDIIDEDSFKSLILKLHEIYVTKTQKKTKHLVIHRDGKGTNEAQNIGDLEQEMDVSIDLVEIHKDGAPRLQQPENEQGTPSKDIAVGNETEGIAYLVNTRAKKENGIYPAPKTLKIRRLAGKTSIKILAAQVYALTLVNYNSYRNTERLPITIYYADAWVDWIKNGATERDFERLRQNPRLIWLSGRR